MTIEEDAARYGRTVEEEKARNRARRLERGQTQAGSYDFNEQIRATARELGIDTDFMYILCRAGGKELSRTHCKLILGRGGAKAPKYSAFRDTYEAFLDGVELWKNHGGTKGAFEMDFLLSVIANLKKKGPQLGAHE